MSGFLKPLLLCLVLVLLCCTMSISDDAGSSQIHPAAVAFERLDRALVDKDLPATKTCVLRIVADFPSDSESIFRADRIERMLTNGWSSYVVKLMDSGIGANVPTFTWVTPLFVKMAENTEPLNAIFPSLQRAYKEFELEHAFSEASSQLQMGSPASIHLMEYANSRLPNNVRIRNRLADYYFRARRLEAAYDLALRNVEAGSPNGNDESSSVSILCSAARGLNRWQETSERLWSRRDSLSISCAGRIGLMHAWQEETTQGLKWMDYAAGRVKYNTLEEARQGQTGQLFSSDYIESRLRCLVKVGRDDDARKFLAEADRIRPRKQFNWKVPVELESAGPSANSSPPK